MSDLRDKLKSEIMPGAWPELRYQFARGGLLLVRPDHDLLEVALAIATDDQAEVGRLLSEGALWRARDDDARAFEAAAHRFQFVIVQPWVLAQGIGLPAAE
ncbi:MAG: DUF2288 family protein [Polyangiales bacterium]